MTPIEILIAFVAGILASIIGGALGAMWVGGKDIGYSLSAMMGCFYGPVAGVIGVAAGLLALFYL